MDKIEYSDCEACEGTGRLAWNQECEICEGTGRIW